MYDIFMITYDEPNGDENWKNLKSRQPLAKRVHGIKGILNAHKECAKKSRTKMFWVVDGDSEVLETFKFDYEPPHHQQEFIHVWRARNAVNGLIYGYGGIKLLSTARVLDMPEMATDMTTSLSNMFVVMPELASVTHFNTSEFNAWRAAFRECCKLSSEVIARQKSDETRRRLDIWQSMGENKPFGKFVLDGAKKGIQYGRENAGNEAALKLVNDFEWLKQRFDNDKPE